MGIVKLIKKIIQVKNNDLSFLNVGDIIWAKRYHSVEEQNKIKKGHQESPYVVIKKARNKVYAMPCTSNPHQEVKWKMLYYSLGKLNYNMNKNTYVNCIVVNELKKVQFVEVIGHLRDNDLNQLKKCMYIISKSNCKVKPNIEKKYLDFKLGVGDVIMYKDDKYYIDAVHEREYEVVRLRNAMKKGKRILINDTYYSFIFETKELIKKKRYDLVDTFNSGEVEAINQYRNRYLEKLKHGLEDKKSLKIGAVIDYNGNMFYVYEKSADSIYVYRIYSYAKMEKGMATVLVKEGMYKTFFERTKISRENLKYGYKIRRCASQEEIEYNLKLLNAPKSERNRKRKELCSSDLRNKQIDVDDIIPMMILKNSNNNKNYLVLKRDENIIEVVNIENMGDLYSFELEQGNCPFECYRIVSKEEFDMYLKKVQEFKDVVSMFN